MIVHTWKIEEIAAKDVPAGKPYKIVDVAIPAEVVAKRAAIVAECTRLETAIAGCADVPALIAVVGSQNWGE